MLRTLRRLAEWPGRAIAVLTDASAVRTPAAAIAVTSGLAISMLLVHALVYATNGTSNVFLHVMYVPIIVASICLGIVGGLAAALGAGYLMGPAMPLDVELGIAQALPNAIYRTVFFVLIAVTTAAFTQATRARQRELAQAKDQVTELSSRNLRLFARLVDARDEQTAGHCERVAHNTVLVGRALGMSERELMTLYWAGMLHDLGKLGVPEAILHKPSTLSDEEFAKIKEHAAFGESILLDISDGFRDIAKGVRSHHERWDGTGYPDRLAGESIPLSARIIAVVDVFEAVTSHRPYRGPMDREAARDLIREGAGTHFDPQVAGTFLMLERNDVIRTEDVPEPQYDTFIDNVIARAQVTATLVN
jgi:hypothetical protein